MTTSSNWADPRYASIVRLLTGRLGLSFRPDDHDRVQLGIDAAMKRSGESDLLEYRRLLEQDPDVWDDLVVELTIGETYFFREHAHFSFLRDEVLPDLLQRRGPDHALRVWSAGCASGEEAYSLAILFDREGLREQSHILATDVSTAALAKAQQAVYSDWSLRGHGAAMAKPYLTRRGEMSVLEQRIRDQVDFQVLNLAVDVYPSIISGTRNVDIIMCRNVLIYFDSETVGSIARRFYDSLAEGGWLITASADPQLDEFAEFETVVHDACVYYRRAISTTKGIARQPVKRQDLLAMTSASGDAVGRPLTVDARKTPNGDASRQQDVVRAENGLRKARRALAEGRYEEAVTLTCQDQLDADAWVVRVQALANVDLTRAELACVMATAQHALSAHVHYLHAALLLQQDRGAEAAEAARRVIYLDRNLIAAHLLLGSSLRQAGDLAAAERAFRNAYELSASRPPAELVEFSEGETAGQLARAAKRQLERIQGASGAAK